MEVSIALLKIHISLKISVHVITLCLMRLLHFQAVCILESEIYVESELHEPGQVNDPLSASVP